MKYRLWITLVTVGLLLGSVTYFHHQFRTVYTSESGIAYNFSGELTVVTYNIRYGKGIDGTVNLSRSIDTLKELNADIISLQEVERFSFRSNFLDQVQHVANELNMDVLYYPSLSYPGFYYGNVILSRFPMIKTEVLPLLSKGENRSVIIAKVVVPQWDEVYVINTHLGLHKEERLEGIMIINEWLGKIEKPILLTGDLNSTPKMGEYAHWSDYIKKSNEGIQLKTFYNTDWQIDYIFHSPHFSVAGVKVFESNASDHFPVVAVFRMQPD
jgi:endonuclease/exonuclease/phosphatase family metal-dependent hydrolase